MLAIFGIAGAVAYAGLRRPLTWDSVLAKIRRDFPDAPGIDLAGIDRLEKTHALVFVDTRAAEEFAVSHIPGARHLPSIAGGDVGALHEAAADGRPTATIFYCSVGYRSGKATERAIGMGLGNAYNFEGSIFAWANAGRALETDGGKPVTYVHPFNARWAQLLDLV